MLIRAGPELEMPKLRIDILERARAIMQSYGDEQLLLWVHAKPGGDTDKSQKAESEVRLTLVKIRCLLESEFHCLPSTAASYIAKIIKERSEKYHTE